MLGDLKLVQQGVVRLVRDRGIQKHSEPGLVVDAKEYIEFGWICPRAAMQKMSFSQLGGYSLASVGGPPSALSAAAAPPPSSQVRLH